jgi:tRNA threonylcarbamoyladenosine biosynthesis protein TsaB
MSKLLRRLAIDTATDYLYVALSAGDKVIESYYQPGKRDHSVKLLQEIERMFKKYDWQVSTLDEIIVGIGPGSYTGLRIGVVVAKVFGWNNNIPVKTVSSLALLASAYQGDSLILSEIDARRGNAFLGVYQNTREGLKLVMQERLTNLQTFMDSLSSSFVRISYGEPDLLKILSSNLLEEVKDIHLLSPNYLRLTEAERNKINSSR